MEDKWEEDNPESLETAQKHDGEIATILSQDYAIEPGNKDFEYYNIMFNDGEELYNVNGYFLDEE